MKKAIVLILILAFVLAVVGCTAPKEEKPSPSPSGETPSPSIEPTEEPSPTIPPHERVFDADGNLILGENGHLKDGMAAVDGVREFTLEEVIKLIPYSDGALATAVDCELGRRLLKDFDTVLSKISAAELPEDRVPIEMLALGIGFELQLDLEGGIVTQEACQILYEEHEGLTERERYVLDKIIEGFEKDYSAP